MDPLNEILNIICKRDTDTYQSVSRETDLEQVMADAIDRILDKVYDAGKKEGIQLMIQEAIK